jgi:hypothetical protein
MKPDIVRRYRNNPILPRLDPYPWKPFTTQGSRSMGANTSCSSALTAHRTVDHRIACSLDGFRFTADPEPFTPGATALLPAKSSA